MDLQSRKIEFVQTFLQIKSEKAISKLENLLKKEVNSSLKIEIKPMNKEELNLRIDQSESDFKNNLYKSSEELLSKFDK
ncbi:MAG: hypothetical protein MUF43_01800 [Flavobacterium sp.]|jgi:hypothetical protein|nr:hypothetical protein [Flavobacterium sp.]